MTGASPVLDRPALLAALSRMTIEPPDPGIRFEQGLARRQGWNVRFAERVTHEYRRFLYLAATAGFEVTPSLAVDEAWHLHLRLPHYREVLCGRILGRPLDHLPGTGTAEDDARCAGQYEETLALYERVFGKPAPRDIWPRPDGAEEGDLERRPVRAVGLSFAVAGLIAGLSTIALGMPTLGAWLLIGSFLLGLVCFPFQAMVGVMRRRNGSAGCGGGCGAGSDGGSGCCASCGGGCGGGD